MSALECCRRQAGSDRSPAAWICIRPTWSPSSTLLSGPPVLAPADAGGGQDRRADALTVRTALAPRPGPLTAGQLTHAPGMAAAAHHSRQCRRPGQPGPGGPLALRPIPPGTWTVTPRLDILTQAQDRALRHLTGAAILDDDLPAAACRAKRHLRRSAGTARLGSPPKPNSRKPACPAASTARTRSTSATTTKFSLRYSDDGHIARELGEPPSAGPAHNISGPRCRGQAGYPRVSTRAGPGSHSPAGQAQVRAGPGAGSGRRAVAVEGRRLT